MSLDIWAGNNDEDYSHRDQGELALDSNGTYWFLYRYFEAANLHRKQGELLDLYGGNQIDGYQLIRLRYELELAKKDVSFKPETWRVLTGWETTQSVSNEIWQEVSKSETLSTIDRLLNIINYVEAKGLKLIAMGD